MEWLNRTLRAARGRTFAAAIVGVLIVFGVLVAWLARPGTAPVEASLRSAQSWGYQLQSVDIGELDASARDMLVIDPTRTGGLESAWSAEAIDALKTGPEGGRRVVLGYLSIGEAENYRDYWQAEWDDAPPDWIGAENPQWPGNFAVEYWRASWQNLLFGQSDTPLERMIAQGFDGVYLDRVDAFYGRPERARSEMIELIANLAERARSLDPGFLVVQQNAEGLLEEKDHAAIIDGVAKEDLWFGTRQDGTRNPARMTRTSLRHLNAFARSGKPVFIVEYALTDAEKALVRRMARDAGFVPTFASRALDSAPAEDGD